MIKLLSDWRAYWPDNNLERWAVGSLYAFALLAPVSTSLGQLSQAIMLVVAIVYVSRYQRVLLRSPLVVLVLAFAFLVLIRGMVAAWVERPDLAAMQWDGVSTWVKTMLFPIVLCGIALCASGNWLRHGVGVLLATLLAYTLVLLWSMDFGNVVAVLSGELRRYNLDQGYRRMALLVPALIIGLVLLCFMQLSRVFVQGRQGSAWGIVRALALFLLLLTFIAALFSTGSRNGWLAAATGLIVLGACSLWYFRQGMRHDARVLIAGLTALTLVLGGVLAYSWDALENRWSRSAPELSQAAEVFVGERDVYALQSGSVGTRIVYWAFGWEMFKERPWFGYGPADQRHLTDENPVPPQLEGRDDTYHNSHIDILLRFGAVGYGLLALGLMILLREAQLNMQQTGTPRILGLYAVAFMAAMAFWSMNAQIIHRFPMEHLYGVILGVMAASYLSRFARHYDHYRETVPEGIQ